MRRSSAISPAWPANSCARSTALRRSALTSSVSTMSLPGRYRSSYSRTLSLWLRIFIVPELRKDPVTGRCVIISTDRARRPSDFSRERVVLKNEGLCPFCPGHESKTPPEIMAYRPDDSHERNVSGWNLRVIPNKFPALGIEGDLDRMAEGMFDRMNGIGAHDPDRPQCQAQETCWVSRGGSSPRRCA